ncbi:MAG: hypothetical protein IE881_03220 [Epsilonproteobacteria bacterium]|nr:hypothetical protein [Campylobacterota bacterium]
MVLLFPNIFNLNFDYFAHKNKVESDLFSKIRDYIQLYKSSNNLAYILRGYAENLDTLLLINRLDTVDKIDEILVNLENLSEITNKLLESDNLKLIYNLPLRYILNKLEDNNMLLQGLLLSSQAHL